jgi:hypothetical protein
MTSSIRTCARLALGHLSVAVRLVLHRRVERQNIVQYPLHLKSTPLRQTTPRLVLFRSTAPEAFAAARAAPNHPQWLPFAGTRPYTPPFISAASSPSLFSSSSIPSAPTSSPLAHCALRLESLAIVALCLFCLAGPPTYATSLSRTYLHTLHPRPFDIEQHLQLPTTIPNSLLLCFAPRAEKEPTTCILFDSPSCVRAAPSARPK